MITQFRDFEYLLFLPHRSTMAVRYDCVFPIFASVSATTKLVHIVSRSGKVFTRYFAEIVIDAFSKTFPSWSLDSCSQES